MFHRFLTLLQRAFTIYYAPEPGLKTFADREQTQETPQAQVTAAVLSIQEGHRLFGVPLGRRSIQPVYLRIVNRHTAPLRLYVLDIDPHYYTPLEAAGINHFSVMKRLSAYGVAAWFFLPLLLIAPLKLFTVGRANRRMDECFRNQSFPLRPIPPGETAEGFIYTTLDAGNKTVRVCLYSTGGAGTEDASAQLSGLAEHPSGPAVDLTFLIPVPGISADYLRRDFADIYPESDLVQCDLPELTKRLQAMPAATTNAKALKHGDPVNLTVIGEFETVLSAFTARWDECETITLKTCWKTARAFLFGQEYRYSPVSPLYLFERSQDVALQRIRGSINERLHLRLWLTPLRFNGLPVWVGQISRDIGVRFTTQVWNLTTHRVDPNVDESRDYVVEDLLRAERVNAVGYVSGVGPCGPDHPRHNLTGDPYFTDGKRAVIGLSTSRTHPRYVAWE
ncbi:LssY C-terminal domain-containing protein [Planctomicrobium piriforme]|uniref:LssY C-terminus n=1 Tax=Planctomicrobium piriforme TaxID=1576369 RepID=A0A1I3QG63_9PLAN|nr:LssY C-terminal domain-containing protein [Planctomicrobium piriforme]SFJ32988.1 LssY C-terminus [Planctomicrobium piriforme]